MKILFINNDKGWGGGQEILLSLTAALRAKGHDLHCVCRDGSPSERAFRQNGNVVHPFRRRGIAALGAVFGMARLFRTEKYDVVAVNREHDLTASALAWRIAFPFGGPGRFVVCYHTATDRWQPLAGAADRVVCISSFVRDRLLERNRQLAGKIVLIPNGIVVGEPPDVGKFDPDRRRRFFSGAGFPLLGMVGDFFKNQAEMLDVAALIRSEFPGLKLALVGDTNDRALTAALREKTRRLGLEEQVIFTGKIPHDRMTDVYYDFDLSVSTFRREGFGLVHLESLAAGTPVVAYNEGGQVDFLRAAGGVLIDGGPTEFSRAVTDLLRDHGRRAALGIDGYRHAADDYSLGRMADAYDVFFHGLCGA